MNPRVLWGLLAIYAGSILLATNLDQNASLKNMMREAEREAYALTEEDESYEHTLNEAEWEREEREREGEHHFDEPLKFIEFQKTIRTREGETVPGYAPGYKTRELRLAKANAEARQRTARTQAVTFTERGPGNVPGRTRALLAVPGTSGTWIAGAATGGLWKTTNSGSTWTEKNDNLTTLPIAELATDNAGTRIYAGTGEFISSFYSAIGDGIYVSTDQGDTWAPLASTQGQADFAIVTSLVVNPDNANVVVVTTVPPQTNLNDNTSAIMRSTDGGLTWTKVKEVTGYLEQIVATPGNFNIQYASHNGVGVWKSADAGVTWNLSNDNMSPTGNVTLAVSPVNPNKIYASAEGNMTGTGSDLYVSQDAGATWGVANITFNSTAVNFLGGQGFYDNVAMCDPFNENLVYFGGVNLFRASIGAASGSFNQLYVDNSETSGFVTMVSFSGSESGVSTNGQTNDIEIRFGAGQSQKAHRFLIPEKRTNGVAASEYTYQDYIDVPFTVWDVTTPSSPRQLAVAFRDQNRNGVFDLVKQYLTTGETDYLLNSREYVFVSNNDYSTTANSNMTASGGQENNLLYSVFMALANSATWNPNSLPTATLAIGYTQIPRYTATTITVSDAYGDFDRKNVSNQQQLSSGLHPDHHIMIPININTTTKAYQLLLGNDGGVFQSASTTTPGTTDGAWTFKGLGYNTSQFYGADKKPGADVYIGGMQDNGTRVSPTSANAQSAYTYALGGDGFEVLWHPLNPNYVLGTIYNGAIYRSTTAAASWTASSGLTTGNTFPFITKLSHSKDFPDRVFTVSTAGVHISQDFGATWSATTAISSQFASSATSLDVEVSRANANIVWAGSGMSGSRKLFVSTDGGATFSATNNFTAVTLGSITRLASHPTEPNTAYALFSFSDAPKVLRTRNLGNTWEDISGFGNNSSSNNGFPDVTVYCLYVRPDNTDIIWAGTEIGIVESVDNGVTWALRTDFPKVSVWDMKGQDDQVVIATHGRGIWTATIGTPQSGYIKPSTIVAAGSTPRKTLALRLQHTGTFDSLRILTGTTVRKTVRGIKAGTQDVELTLTAGTYAVTVINYRNGAPYQGASVSLTHLNIQNIATSYATYFSSTSDFSLSGFSLQSFANAGTGERQTLQTPHPYLASKTYSATLLKPVKVASGSSQLHYADIALVEPGNDAVLVEATTNGLDWKPLLTPYDASAVAAWQTAYTANTNGNSSMWNAKDINLLDTFTAGDSLLFRWRMTTNTSIQNWGWALNYITIQETPLATETDPGAVAISAYPNPTRRDLNLQYTLNKPATVNTRLLDVFGREIQRQSWGTRASGEHTEALDLSTVQAGTYLLLVYINDRASAVKVAVQR